MQHVSQSSLNEDLGYRLSYVQSFLSFDPSDGSAIQASGPLLKPLVPSLLDAVYTKLLRFDVTSAAFVPKLSNEPDLSPKPLSPQELTLNHPNIKRQISFLRGYVLRIVGNNDWEPTSPIWSWMSHVAIMHTGSTNLGTRRNKFEVRIEYMHIALLLGHLEDMILSAIEDINDVDVATKAQILRAWNKLLWIQNDLFAKPYCQQVTEIGRSPLFEKRRNAFEATKSNVLFATFGGALATMLFHLLN